MKTNSFFKLNRFGLYIRQDLLLNRNKYLLLFAVLVIVIYLLLVYQISNSREGFIIPLSPNQYHIPNGSGYSTLLMLIMIGLLGVFIGTSFADFGKKVTSTTFLLLPASIFEKYLYPLLFRGVLGAIVFILVFWIDAQMARWTLMDTKTFVMNGYEIIPFNLSMLINEAAEVNIIMSFSFVSFGMFFLAVPLFFKKQAFIKAVLALFVLYFIVVFCFVGLSHLFYPETKGFEISLETFKITERISNNDVYCLSVVCVSWIFLMFLGYFKLKEKRL